MPTKDQLQAENDALRAITAGAAAEHVCSRLAQDNARILARARKLALELSELRSIERTNEQDTAVLQRLRVFARSVIDHHLGEGNLSALINIEDGSMPDLRSMLVVYADNKNVRRV